MQNSYGISIYFRFIAPIPFLGSKKTCKIFVRNFFILLLFLRLYVVKNLNGKLTLCSIKKYKKNFKVLRGPYKNKSARTSYGFIRYNWPLLLNLPNIGTSAANLCTKELIKLIYRFEITHTNLAFFKINKFIAVSSFVYLH